MRIFQLTCHPKVFSFHHPHAQLPDAGASPLSLGWLLACRQVNSALLFKLVLFSQCRYSAVGVSE